MSEELALASVARFPNRTALLRQVGPTIVPMLGRLERLGYLRNARDGYRLTRRGRSELLFQRSLERAVVRALGAGA